MKELLGHFYSHFFEASSEVAALHVYTCLL